MPDTNRQVPYSNELRSVDEDGDVWSFDSANYVRFVATGADDVNDGTIEFVAYGVDADGADNLSIDMVCELTSGDARKLIHLLQKFVGGNNR